MVGSLGWSCLCLWSGWGGVVFFIVVIVVLVWVSVGRFGRVFVGWWCCVCG